MAKQKLGRKRVYFCCSSSIANFKEKIKKNLGLPEWDYKRNRNVIFLGMYHWVDYLKFLWCEGKKAIFWCGSDILNLEKFPNKLVVPLMIPLFRQCVNFVETAVERAKLAEYGISSELLPLFFGDIEKYKPIDKEPVELRDLWICIRQGREKEYGLDLVKLLAFMFPMCRFHIYGIEKRKNFPENVIFHSWVREDLMDKEIRNYDGALRLNLFDGFSEVEAKALLLGQPVFNLKGIIPFMFNHFRLKKIDFLVPEEIKKVIKKDKEILKNLWK